MPSMPRNGQSAERTNARAGFKGIIEEIHNIRTLLHDAIAMLKEAVRAEGGSGASGAVSAEGKAMVDDDESMSDDNTGDWGDMNDDESMDEKDKDAEMEDDTTATTNQ